MTISEQAFPVIGSAIAFGRKGRRGIVKAVRSTEREVVIVVSYNGCDVTVRRSR